MTKYQLKELIKEIINEVTIKGSFSKDTTPFNLTFLPKISNKFAANPDEYKEIQSLYNFIQDQYNNNAGKPHSFDIQTNLLPVAYVIGRYFGYSVIYINNKLHLTYDGNRVHIKDSGAIKKFLSNINKS